MPIGTVKISQGLLTKSFHVSNKTWKRTTWKSNKRRKWISRQYLTAVLLRAVRAAHWGCRDGARQLSMRAQHGVGLPWACRAQLPDARRKLSTRVVFQDVGFPFAGALVNL